ncbi:MAG: hypothetical protein HY291_16605 [Planctomycetes bacterium]|nr:hypothetical protein [Planctomycetota bacterium]
MRGFLYFAAGEGIGMKFYFCETCGKRVTEDDMAAGEARDKKLKGVFCKNCSVGVMTMEMAALTDLPKTDLPAPPPVRVSTASGSKLSPPHLAAAKSSSRSHPKPADGSLARGPQADRPGEKRNPYVLALFGGAAALLVAVAALLLSGSAPKKDVARNEPKTEPAPKPPEAAPALPPAATTEQKPEQKTEAADPKPSAEKTAAHELSPKEAYEQRVKAGLLKPEAPPDAHPPPPPAEARPPADAGDAGPSITADFEGAFDARWKIEGAEVSEEQAHGGKKSLKLAEGQSAALSLGAKNDQPVRVTMWIYDNGKKLGAGVSATGPGWGVKTGAGDTFCLRTCWRPYLGGDAGYVWFNTGENKWFTPHLAKVPRKEGWNEWVFDFTDPKAPKIACGGIKVSNLTEKFVPAGAVAVCLIGGQTSTGPLYVDDIRVEYPKK